LHEEVTQKGVVLVYNGAKLTVRGLKKLIGAALKAIINQATKPKHGKQSVKSLLKKDQGAQTLQVSNERYKEFSRIAKKYGVDFAIKKVKGEETKHLIFFKARDADAITAAFDEYSGKALRKAKKPSILGKLQKFKDVSKTLDFIKAKDRAQEISR